MARKVREVPRRSVSWADSVLAMEELGLLACSKGDTFDPKLLSELSAWMRISSDSEDSVSSLEGKVSLREYADSVSESKLPIFSWVDSNPKERWPVTESGRY